MPLNANLGPWTFDTHLLAQILCSSTNFRSSLDNMEKVSKAIKRGYAAMFDADAQEHPSNKVRKILATESNAAASGELTPGEVRKPKTDDAPADKTDPGESARLITVEYNEKRCNALLLPDELLEAWRSICELNRQRITTRQQVEARGVMLREYIDYANREQRRLLSLPVTQDVDAEDAIERRRGEVFDRSQEACKIGQEDYEMLDDLEWDLARKCMQANVFVEDVMVASGIVVPRDEFYFNFEVGPDRAFVMRFAVPNEDEATQIAARFA
jgi:hypothetical protein